MVKDRKHGAPVVLLRSRSRIRSDDHLEGLYFVDASTYDVRRAELTLAKRPAPLKRMEIALDQRFRLLKSGTQYSVPHFPAGSVRHNPSTPAIPGPHHLGQ